MSSKCRAPEPVAASTIIPEFISLRDAAVRIVFSIFTIREKVDGGELPAYRISDKPEARSRS